MRGSWQERERVRSAQPTLSLSPLPFPLKTSCFPLILALFLPGHFTTTEQALSSLFSAVRSGPAVPADTVVVSLFVGTLFPIMNAMRPTLSRSYSNIVYSEASREPRIGNNEKKKSLHSESRLHSEEEATRRAALYETRKKKQRSRGSFVCRREERGRYTWLDAAHGKRSGKIGHTLGYILGFGENIFWGSSAERGVAALRRVRAVVRDGQAQRRRALLQEYIFYGKEIVNAYSFYRYF